MHIHTRDNLIEWLEDNAPYKGIRRALVYGTNENLGGFKNIPPGCVGGWIVRIRSKHNREWIVAVGENIKGKYISYILIGTPIPWESWEGNKSSNPLYRGDNPEAYKLLRDKELSNARQTKE